MCDFKKTLVVVEDMFPDATLAIRTKHRFSMALTILLNVRVEFNPVEHRRDMVDAMLHYNLYVKRLDNDTYEAGSHDPDNHVIGTGIRPGIAITEIAYAVLARQ